MQHSIPYPFPYTPFINWSSVWARALDYKRLNVGLERSTEEATPARLRREAWAFLPPWPPLPGRWAGSQAARFTAVLSCGHRGALLHWVPPRGGPKRKVAKITDDEITSSVCLSISRDVFQLKLQTQSSFVACLLRSSGGGRGRQGQGSLFWGAACAAQLEARNRPAETREWGPSRCS